MYKEKYCIITIVNKKQNGQEAWKGRLYYELTSAV